jgi:hypothetical protein
LFLFFFFFLFGVLYAFVTHLHASQLSPQIQTQFSDTSKEKKNYFLFESLFVFFVTSTPFRLHTRAQLAA